MATRLELHNKLLELCDHVYFQPPETLKITYPCIIYSRSRDDLLHADDLAYKRTRIYSITIIDRDPDTDIPDQFSDAFNSTLERHFTKDNLHHFIYSIHQ